MVSEHITNKVLRNLVKRTALVSLLTIFILFAYIAFFTQQAMVATFTIFIVSASFFMSVLVLSGVF